MSSATMMLLSSLSGFALCLAFFAALNRRRQQTEELAAERIASLQRKIDAVLQDGFEPASSENFMAMLRTARLTTGLQAPRLQALAKMDKQAPEKYRILAKLAAQGLGADEIAAALGISRIEAGQLLSLSRMAGSDREQIPFAA